MRALVVGLAAVAAVAVVGSWRAHDVIAADGRVQRYDLSELGLPGLIIRHVLMPPPSLQLRIHPSSAAPGTSGLLLAKLRTHGITIAGLQGNIAFDGANVAIAATTDGRPDCTAASRLQQRNESAFFAFLPYGCSGSACTAIRVIVLSTVSVNPLRSGKLFTCRVTINPAAAPGKYNFMVQQAKGSNPQGLYVPFGNRDSSLTVSGQ